MSKLVEKLMQDIYLSDNMWAYLIDRLIENKKIKITLDNNIRYFENLIEINDKWNGVVIYEWIKRKNC